MEFGKKLRELRKEKHLSQVQLAELFSVHQTTVKDWEVRGKQPPYETLIALARFFEVTTDFLLGLES